MGKSLFKISNSFFLILILCWGINCGPYSFKSTSGGTTFKTIAVPLFDNQTQEYGIREILADSIANRIVRDNSLKIVTESQADVILRGSINKYERAVYTYDQAENVKEYIVRIFVKVALENTKAKKSEWEEPNLQGWGIYNVIITPPETEDDGKAKAIAKLSEDIVNKTVKSW